MLFNKCADCRQKWIPLKWYNFWDCWLCHTCKEKRIQKAIPHHAP